MKYQNNQIYSTPPGEILTPTPKSTSQYIAGELVAQFISTAGMPCKCVNVCAAPQVVQYDIQLLDIYSYNENKIKRILKAFEARYNTIASLERSKHGDFAVITARNERQPLNLRDVLYTHSFNDGPQTVCAVGVDSNNNAVVIDIENAPHILIAGTTGSGKSVLLNSLICSLLYKAPPGVGSFIMIDPKQMELTAYKDLPHLYKPIVTDAKAALETLSAACDEMEQRNKKLAAAGFKSLSEAPHMFPRLYIVIDELAELMLASKKSVESYIVRIAQLGRAAGIHLIIATQKPSSNVVTGLIKANIPTKIALAVSNTSDSVNILNHGGAEKLTGKGDAIIKTPDSIIERRFQSAFTPNEDIHAIVKHYQPEKKSLLNLFKRTSLIA